MLSEERFYSTLAEDLVRVLTVGPRTNALLNALPEPWEEAPAPTLSPEVKIPTRDHDPLLSSVRGSWHMPPALQRRDFELAFRAVDHGATWESVLAEIRAGTFATASALAWHFGKGASWSRSLMWCAIREKAVLDLKTWRAYFPKGRTMKPRTQKPAKPRSTAAVEPFTLPPLDSDDLY